MKIDHEYLKGLLEAFECSDKPETDIQKLHDLGFSYQTPEFLFHMRLLDDRNLIARTDGDSGLDSSNQQMAEVPGLFYPYVSQQTGMIF